MAAVSIVSPVRSVKSATRIRSRSARARVDNNDAGSSLALEFGSATAASTVTLTAAKPATTTAARFRRTNFAAR